VVLSEGGRFMVGRSGSSAGVLPVGVVDAVVVVVSVSLRRFIVGRSGSSAGVAVLLVVEPVVGFVVELVVELGLAGVPEPAVSELRRFIVGRSESSLVDGLVVLAVVVVSGLLFVGVAGLLWSLPAAGGVSPLVFVVRCGRFGSGDEAVMADRVLDGFKAVVVFLGAARGLTLP
jgi:hypothetical protein